MANQYEYYLLTTVEYCEVDGYICDMNTYKVAPNEDVEAKCLEVATVDVASVVEVCGVYTDKDGKVRHSVIKEYEFPQFKCKCAQ